VRLLQHQNGRQERYLGFERVLCNKCLVFATGFLKTGARGSAQGNFGLMDLVAGLHWLRENIPAFGGDAERITLMGHGTGAALSNIIAVSPVAKGRSVTLCCCNKVKSGLHTPGRDWISRVGRDVMSFGRRDQAAAICTVPTET